MLGMWVAAISSGVTRFRRRVYTWLTLIHVQAHGPQNEWLVVRFFLVWIQSTYPHGTSPWGAPLNVSLILLPNNVSLQYMRTSTVSSDNRRYTEKVNSHPAFQLFIPFLPRHDPINLFKCPNHPRWSSFDRPRQSRLWLCLGHCWFRWSRICAGTTARRGWWVIRKPDPWGRWGCRRCHCFVNHYSHWWK
jgi:hypothetical protein